MSITGEGMRDAVFTALFGAGAYGDMTEPELTAVKANMLLTYEAIVDYLIANTVVNVATKTGEDANTKINSVFAAGVPVPTDGGTALQIAWIAGSAIPNAQDSEGGIS